MAFSGSSSNPKINNVVPLTDVKAILTAAITINKATNEALEKEKTRLEAEIKKLEETTIPEYIKKTLDTLVVKPTGDYPKTITQLTETINKELGDAHQELKALSVNTEALGVKNKLSWTNRKWVSGYIFYIEHCDRSLRENKQHLESINGLIIATNHASLKIGSLEKLTIPQEKFLELNEIKTHTQRAKEEVIKYINKKTATPITVFNNVTAFINDFKVTLGAEPSSKRRHHRDNSAPSTPATHRTSNRSSGSQDEKFDDPKSPTTLNPRTIDFRSPEQEIKENSDANDDTPIDNKHTDPQNSTSNADENSPLNGLGIQTSSAIPIPTQPPSQQPQNTLSSTYGSSVSVLPPFTPNTNALPLTSFIPQPNNAGRIINDHKIEDDHYAPPPSDQNDTLQFKIDIDDAQSNGHNTSDDQSQSLQSETSELQQEKDENASETPFESAFDFINDHSASANIPEPSSTQSTSLQTDSSIANSEKKNEYQSTPSTSVPASPVSTTTVSLNQFTTPSSSIRSISPTDSIATSSLKLPSSSALTITALNAITQKVNTLKSQLEALNNASINLHIQTIWNISGNPLEINKFINGYKEEESFQALPESDQTLFNEFQDAFFNFKVLNVCIKKRDLYFVSMIKSIAELPLPEAYTLSNELKEFLNSLLHVSNHKMIETLCASFELRSKAYAELKKLSDSQPSDESKNILSRYKNFIIITTQTNVTSSKNAPSATKSLTASVSEPTLSSTHHPDNQISAPTAQISPIFNPTPSPLPLPTNNAPPISMSQTVNNVEERNLFSPKPAAVITVQTAIYQLHNSVTRTINSCKELVGIAKKTDIYTMQDRELANLINDEKKTNYLLRAKELKQFVQANIGKNCELSDEDKKNLIEATNTDELSSEELIAYLTPNSGRADPVLDTVKLFELIDIQAIARILKGQSDDINGTKKVDAAKRIVKDLICVQKLNTWYTQRQNLARRAEEEKNLQIELDKQKEIPSPAESKAMLSSKNTSKKINSDVDSPTGSASLPLFSGQHRGSLSQPVFGDSPKSSAPSSSRVPTVSPPILIQTELPWYKRWAGKISRFFSRCWYCLTCCSLFRNKSKDDTSTLPPPRQSMGTDGASKWLTSGTENNANDVDNSHGNQFSKGSTATYAHNMIVPITPKTPSGYNGNNTPQQHRYTPYGTGTKLRSTFLSENQKITVDKNGKMIITDTSNGISRQFGSSPSQHQ